MLLRTIYIFILIILNSGRLACQNGIYPYDEDQLYSITELKSDIALSMKDLQVNNLAEVKHEEFVEYVDTKIINNYLGKKKEIARLYLAVKYFELNNDFVEMTHNRLKLITIFPEQLSKDDLLRLTKNIGEGYFKSNNYFFANYFFQKCLVYKNVNKDKLYRKIGRCFLSINLLDSAEHYFRKALIHGVTTQDRMRSMNNIGHVQFLLGNYNSALTYYNGVLEIFNKEESTVDSMHFYNTLSNIGSVYYKLGHYSEALEVFEKIDSSNFYKTTPSSFKFEIQSKKFLVQSELQDCNFLGQKLAELEILTTNLNLEKGLLRFLEISLDHCISCESHIKIKAVKTKLELIQAEIYVEKQKELLLTQGLSQLIYNDQLSLVRANLKLENSSKELLEESNFRLKISLMLGFFGALSLIIFFVYWRLQKRKKEKLKFEFDSMTLESKRLKIMSFMKMKESNSILFEEIGHKLKEILESENLEKEINNMILFIKSKSKAELDREKIIGLTDDIGESLTFKLNFCAEYPTLTDTEIQVVMLIRIGMSNKEIAIFRNVEPHSIRVFKNRMKSKLGLVAANDMNTYIKDY